MTTPANRPRYRPTAPAVARVFGELRYPSTWATTYLDDCNNPTFPICYGILMPGKHVPDGIPVVKVRDFDNGTLRVERLQRTKPEVDYQYRRSRIGPGDLLLSIRGSAGEVARVPADLSQGNITQDTARIRPTEHVCRDYLYFALQSDFVQTQIRLETVGQAVKGINLGDVRKLVVPVPPLSEQEAIAEVLSSSDSAIRELLKLIPAKRELRRGLAQQLLSGEIRFPEYSEPWISRQLRDLTQQLSIRDGGQLSIGSVKAVNKLKGLIPMKDRVRAASLHRYKRVPPNAFAYNPMRLNIGSIAMSAEAEDVLVSPDYVVFKCVDGLLDAEYLNHLRRTHLWRHFVNVAGNGSVRVRIYYKDLAAMPLQLPNVEEQRRIADVLNACDQEIRLLKAKLELLKKQRKGLMQKLLTGEIRVKEAAA